MTVKCERRLFTNKKMSVKLNFGVIKVNICSVCIKIKQVDHYVVHL